MKKPHFGRVNAECKGTVSTTSHHGPQGTLEISSEYHALGGMVDKADGSHLT